LNKIITRQAFKCDIDWINSKYREIEFVESKYENEFIVIAELNGQKAGLGRLVEIDDVNIESGGIYVFEAFRKMGVAEKIVSSLCENNPYDNRIIWCLPFENLKAFYSNFGFSQIGIDAPTKVIEKHKWCNKAYNKKVLLLSKYSKTLD